MRTGRSGNRFNGLLLKNSAGASRRILDFLRNGKLLVEDLLLVNEPGAGVARYAPVV
jgi:hypothetical protein